MKLFVCIADNPRLLPHFLRHYSRVEIINLHVAAPPEASVYVDAESRGFNVTRYYQFDVTDSVIGGVSAVARKLAQSPKEEWI
jgi:hypothetical protein